MMVDELAAQAVLKHECVFLTMKKIYDDHVWAMQSDYQN